MFWPNVGHQSDWSSSHFLPVTIDQCLNNTERLSDAVWEFSLPEYLELKVRFKDVFALTAEKRLFTVVIQKVEKNPGGGFLITKTPSVVSLLAWTFPIMLEKVVKKLMRQSLHA